MIKLLLPNIAAQIHRPMDIVCFQQRSLGYKCTHFHPTFIFPKRNKITAKIMFNINNNMGCDEINSTTACYLNNFIDVMSAEFPTTVVHTIYSQNRDPKNNQ